MSTSLSPEDIKALLQSAEKLRLQLAASNTRGKTRRPYYTEKYALWAKGVIDQIFSRGDVLEGQQLGLHNPDIRPETIRTQWYQGVEYLVKIIDPSYQEKVSQITATAHPRKGLILSIKPAASLAELIPVENWRNDIEDFLDESEPGNVLRKAGLPLREEDIIWLDDLLTPLRSSRDEPLFAWERPNLKSGSVEIIRLR